MGQKLVCPVDSAKFESTRPNAVYCSDACRKRASRERRAAAAKAAAAASEAVTAQSSSANQGTSMEQTTRDYLAARELVGLPLAASALSLAREIDGYKTSKDGLSALASAHRAYADILDKLGTGKTAGDRGDELRARREERQRVAREARGG